MQCRHCKLNLSEQFIDLGSSPPSNSYLSKEDLSKVEIEYPLRVFVCENCWLVQTEDFTEADKLFNDSYAYFSSTSSIFLNHAKIYSESIISKLNLDSNSHVIEIASNDGYLLKNFLRNKIPCLGIEPTKSTSDIAKSIGIPVIKDFFGSKLATKIKENNKLADS